jgi:hypothetical protein
MAQGLTRQLHKKGELMAWHRDLHDNCIRKENSWHGTGTYMAIVLGTNTHGKGFYANSTT